LFSLYQVACLKNEPTKDSMLHAVNYASFDQRRLHTLYTARARPQVVTAIPLRICQDFLANGRTNPRQASWSAPSL